MPTLNWIGTEAVVEHRKKVPYCLLEPVPELSCEDSGSGNFIVQGDNVNALEPLLPRYAGQVKFIYIDSPYNTGDEGWILNDNINSPEIRKWLGEVAGKEGETLDRRDRSLCRMYPRLVLLRQFLRDAGAIFVSIDDNEVGNLRPLMDAVFGARNFITGLILRKVDCPNDTKAPRPADHEYVLAYARCKDRLKLAQMSAPGIMEACGRFYHDFLCQLPGGAHQPGSILAMEYNGADSWDGVADDRPIGGLWASLPEGRCRFVMMKDRRWEWIEEKLG